MSEAQTELDNQRAADEEPDEALEGWLPGIDDVPDHVREGDR